MDATSLTHSNIARDWQELSGGRDWPDEAGWVELRRRNVLTELEPEQVLEAVSGQVELSFVVPMPSVSLLQLTPA